MCSGASADGLRRRPLTGTPSGTGPVGAALTAAESSGEARGGHGPMHLGMSIRQCLLVLALVAPQAAQLVVDHPVAATAPWVAVVVLLAVRRVLR